MSWIDIFLLAGLAAALGLAVRKCIRDQKQGKSCGGDCTRCGKNCGK